MEIQYWWDPHLQDGPEEGNYFAELVEPILACPDTGKRHELGDLNQTTKRERKLPEWFRT